MCQLRLLQGRPLLRQIKRKQPQQLDHREHPPEARQATRPPLKEKAFLIPKAAADATEKLELVALGQR